MPEQLSWLNLGAGKELYPIVDGVLESPYLNDECSFLVNVDRCYVDEESLTPEAISESHDDFESEGSRVIETHYCNTDVFEFLQKYRSTFDHVCMYRFMEHIPLFRLQEFLYLLASVVKSGGIIDIIVPDYLILAKRIQEEELDLIHDNFAFWKEWPHTDTVTTTELLNEQFDPHASIWTQERAKYYIELEKRFRITEATSPFELDGRNIHLRVKAKRV